MKYEIIKKHFDDIDISHFNVGDILICYDPKEVDYKFYKTHFHDQSKGFKYGICVLRITDGLPDILDIKAKEWADAELAVINLMK